MATKREYLDGYFVPPHSTCDRDDGERGEMQIFKSNEVEDGTTRVKQGECELYRTLFLALQA
jgi:hypothetical protein